MATNEIKEGNWQLSIFTMNKSTVSGNNYVYKENDSNKVYTKRNVTVNKNGNYYEISYIDDDGKAVKQYYNRVYASNDDDVNSRTIMLRLDGGYQGQANGSCIILSVDDLPIENGGAVNLNYSNLNSATFTPNDKGTFTKGSTNASKWNPCFLPGTLILTPDGYKRVEDLCVGDKVVTYMDPSSPVIDIITWIGHSHAYVHKNKTGDESNQPVRILKHAISDNVPFKDLLVTPEHSLYFDGNFIPARMLVNGSSIKYDPSFDSYDYYHIETKTHSVIMADGMLTESYLDTGNRSAFLSDTPFLYLKHQNSKTWNADAAAPLVVTRNVVEPVYRKIESRARNMGFPVQNKLTDLTQNTDLHLIIENGQIIKPIREANNKAVFLLPKETKSVKIVSNTNRPCDTVGAFVDDRRYLGVLIGEIFLLKNNETIPISDHLSNETLSGWHDIENTTMRWTNGNAQFTSDMLSQKNQCILVLNIISSGPYLRKAEPLKLSKIA